MNKLNIYHYLFTFILIATTFKQVIAQEYTSTGYYYNNFDNNQLGNKLTAFGGASLSVSPINLAPGNGYSLSSTGASVAGGYNLSFITTGTNLNNEQFGYEWTMLYRNNGGNTDNSQTIDNNKNSWRYWLFANNTDLNNMQGYYLTQNGSNLQIMMRVNQNDSRSLLSFDLSSIGANNTTYAIRVQRLKRGNQYVCQLFVDPYTLSKKEASTARGDLNYEANNYNIYNYSGLQVSSTQGGRFQFDEFKLYSMKFELSGANEPVNGISSPLYNGQKEAAIYGLRMMTRGLFDFKSLILDLTVSDGSKSVYFIFLNAKLFKSFDDYFGNADDVFVTNMDIEWRQIKIEPFTTDRIYSLGDINGALLPAAFYFIKADVQNDMPIGISFSFTKLAKLGGESAQIDFSVVPSVNQGGTTTGTSTSGSVKDWKGESSTEWNNANNWYPVGVPGDNDLARIGVVSFTNPPTVATNKTVGNIIFGTVKTPTLTVNVGATLGVKNRVESQEGTTISGAGALTINGGYSAKPTANNITITSSIASLSALNFMLNTQTKSVTFNVNSGNTTIINSLQTLGINPASITVGDGATLTLNGASPFSLGANNHTLTLSNGSTVAYNGDKDQGVSTNGMNYKNISFSGAGVKKVAAGTLNVAGNWNSLGGRIDLLTSGAEVTFNGGTQAITDLGSDVTNGVVFKNVNFSGGGTKTLPRVIFL